ncbi:MAG: hypothetical protein J6S60_04715 [Oscillospiraceae bacterium]|nr:hypothetical protein [Oscillospiraceae bacterium]
MDRLLKPREIAEYLHVDIKRARTLMRSMPCINVGSSDVKPRLLVAERDLAAWVESRKAVAAAPARERKGKAPQLRVLDGFEADGRLKRRKA